MGDSPIVGAGTYADNKTCAVSCTGIGEHFIRNAVAYDVSARMAYKDELVPEAVSHVIHKTRKPGDGGMQVDVHGNVFATGPGGVLVLSPKGKLLGRIATGEATANVGWGNDGRVLYLTSDMYLCGMRTQTKGVGFE